MSKQFSFFYFFLLHWKLYNCFPWMGRWTKNRKLLKNHFEVQYNHFRDLIHQLKISLNPEMCRCLIDSFLIRKQKDEVSVMSNTKLFRCTLRIHWTDSMVSTWTQDSCVTDPLYHEMNLITVVGNLFAAGTDTTGASLRWALLFMAKYPQIQGEKDIHVVLFICWIIVRCQIYCFCQFWPPMGQTCNISKDELTSQTRYCFHRKISANNNK